VVTISENNCTNFGFSCQKMGGLGQARAHAGEIWGGPSPLGQYKFTPMKVLHENPILENPSEENLYFNKPFGIKPFLKKTLSFHLQKTVSIS
jgi:hypothetical protein